LGCGFTEMVVPAVGTWPSHGAAFVLAPWLGFAFLSQACCYGPAISVCGGAGWPKPLSKAWL